MTFKHILLTGGAGFAGSAAALAIKRGFDCRVTALDNLKRRGSECNLLRLKQGGVEFVHGDVRAREDLMALRPDLIVECSAEPSAQAGYGESPQYLIDTNLGGCLNCLELARRHNAAFLFVSTSRVYPYRLLNELSYSERESRFELSDDQKLPGASGQGIREDFPLDGPRSLYGMTKLAAELAVEEFGDAYGLPYIIDRFGLLTGPYQMAKSDQGVIALWVACHAFGHPLSYIGFGGTGKQVRDFLHADDFANLILDQIANFDLYKGSKFNAGGGKVNSLSLLETTRLCEEVTGRRIAIGSECENRPADVRIYLTDSAKVRGINGWRAHRSARQTIEDIYSWIRSSPRIEKMLFGGD